MYKKVYMHAIGDVQISYDNQIKTLYKIAKAGYLVSLRNQGREDSYGFAGMDYISLCDIEKKQLIPKDKRKNSAYYTFIRTGISLAFDACKLDVIKPKYIDLSNYSNNSYLIMKKLGNNIDRYTDLLDEVQVKDKISLEYLSYITFPTLEFFKNEHIFSRINKYDLLTKKRDEILDILYFFNIKSDIYDIDSGIKLDNEGIKSLVYKK